jgi:hypothetical protein
MNISLARGSDMAADLALTRVDDDL